MDSAPLGKVLNADNETSSKEGQKRKIVKLKNQDQMKGINENQWEDDEHDKDFNTRVNNGRCGKKSTNAWI